MTSDTRESLLRAGEQLFAEHGTHGVSAREIVRAAAVGNASALQYHFGDREGLVQAVLARHEERIDVRRHELLDSLRADADLRELADVLVRPLADELADPSGRRYLRIAAEVINRPGLRIDADEVDPTSSVLRWRARVEPLVDPAAVRLHRRFVAVRFVSVELGRRAAEDHDRGHEVFVSQLGDLVVALLACPVSPQTDERLRSARRP